MEKYKMNSIKTKLAVASIASLFVLVAIFAGSPTEGLAKIGPVTDFNTNFDGGSDYATYCARCHGGDGRGQTAKGRQTHAGDLTKSTVSDAKGIRMITNGSGEMPAFKNSMSAEQIRGVMSYIHGFRR